MSTSTDYYTKDDQGQWRPTKTVNLEEQERKQKQQHRLRLIAAIALALVVVVGGGTFAIVSIVAGPANATLAAAKTYCADLKNQDYVGVYNLLGPALHTQESQAAFMASERAIDNQRGTVTSCQAKSAQSTDSGMTATISITRQHISATTTKLDYDQGTGSWKLSSLPDTAIAPLTTVYLFCNELQSTNFGKSFAYLSPHFQQASGGIQTFLSNAAGSVNITGAIKACHLQQTFFNKDNTSVVVKFGIDFDRFINLPSQVTLVQDVHTLWKVDSMQFTAAGQSLPFPLPLSTVQNILDILKSICSLAPPNAICDFINLFP